MRTAPRRAHDLFVELVDNPGALQRAVWVRVEWVDRMSRNRPASAVGRHGNRSGIAGPRIGAKTADGGGEEPGADRDQEKVQSRSITHSVYSIFCRGFRGAFSSVRRPVAVRG